MIMTKELTPATLKMPVNYYCFWVKRHQDAVESAMAPTEFMAWCKVLLENKNGKPIWTIHGPNYSHCISVMTNLTPADETGRTRLLSLETTLLGRKASEDEPDEEGVCHFSVVRGGKVVHKANLDPVTLKPLSEGKRVMRKVLKSLKDWRHRD